MAWQQSEIQLPSFPRGFHRRTEKGGGGGKERKKRERGRRKGGRKKKKEERERKEKEEKERILKEQQEKKRILRETLQNNISLISTKRKKIEELYIKTIFILQQPIKKTQKKSIYNAGILLYDNWYGDLRRGWNYALNNSTDNEKKLELSKNIIRLLDKLIELSNKETKAHEKSLKKEEDKKTIIKLLGL